MKINIQRREWHFVGLIIIAILLFSSVPYAFASLNAPPDKRFMGFVYNVSDHGQYLSWYKEFQSSFVISNKLTPEPNSAAFFNLLWFVLGRLGYYTGWSYVAVYQLFRWASGAAFMIALYAFSALFFSDLRQRRAAFMITALGSGLGWIWVIVKYLTKANDLPFPQDVYVAEGNSFLSIMAYPHFAEAASLILAVLGLLLLGERRGQLRYAVAAGLTAHFLGWQHGYDLLIVWGVPCTYAGIRLCLERRWPDYWFKAMLITGLLSWPPALYSVWLTHSSPIWEQVLDQFSNAGVYTPNLFHIFILMGLPLILAIITLALLARGHSPSDTPVQPTERKHLFLGVWFVAGWALCYIPTDFQIHMLNSWQVPIAYLATIGLYKYVAPLLQRRWSARRSQTIVVLAFLALILLTNGYLWAWRSIDLNRHDYPYFLYNDEVAALEWLDENALPDDIVLSSYDVGRYLPGLTGCRAFLAHWAQTVEFYDKRDRVAQFFALQTDHQERLATLRTFKVDYVFYGPAERALGQYDPSTSASFAPVFSNSRVTIYQVQDNTAVLGLSHLDMVSSKGGWRSPFPTPISWRTNEHTRLP